jgi:dephospho-CoA kinase
MRRSENPKSVIVIVGMPGAGKSLASRVAKEMRMPIFVSGDIIRDEAKRRGLIPNKKNLGQLMLHIRKSEGMGAVARRLVPLIEESPSHNVVYEGARSIEEIEELARHYRVSVIAIHASPETRFRRLLKRKRSDRPRTRADFWERDKRELTVGVGRVISLADRMVENEESIPALQRRMRRVLKTKLPRDQ